MTFKFQVDTNHTTKDENDFGDKDNSVSEVKRYKTCYVDADTFVVRGAKLMQEDYIEVLHKPSGRRKEFRNKTEFGIRGDKIIETGWLHGQNSARVSKGLEPFPLDDFEVLPKARLNPEFKDFDEALKNSEMMFASHIKAIKQEMDSENYVLCISSGNGNYRNDESKTIGYKSSRLEKPIYFKEFKDKIAETYKNKIWWTDNNEAEDYIQHVAKQEEAKYGENFENWTICAAYVDKDVNQVYIPSRNYDKYDLGWRLPTKEECELTLVAQTIAGDMSTDTIQGLPTLSESVTKQFGLRKANGVSKATAEILLEGCNTIQEMWTRAIYCYQQYYGMDKSYKFKDVHGVDQDWTWIDYMQQCYVLVKMQEYQGQIPCLRKYLSSIGVDYTVEVSYDKKVDAANLIEKVNTCNATCDELTECLSKYKTLNKSDLVSKLEDANKLLDQLKGNLSLLVSKT